MQFTAKELEQFFEHWKTARFVEDGFGGLRCKRCKFNLPAVYDTLSLSLTIAEHGSGPGKVTTRPFPYCRLCDKCISMQAQLLIPLEEAQLKGLIASFGNINLKGATDATKS